MKGLAIGAIFGALALFFLARAAKAITSGEVQSALFPFLCNFASILAGLAITVIFLRGELIWMGCGMAAALVGGAFGVFVRLGKRK